MNFFSKFNFKTRNSKSKLIPDSTKDQLCELAAKLDSNSTSTSDSSVLTEIVPPSEIEFLRSTADYFDSDTEFANNRDLINTENKVRTDREKLVDKINTFDKSQIIDQFLKIIDEKDELITQLTLEKDQLNESVHLYKSNLGKLETSIEDLIEDKCRLQSTVDTLINEIELDKDICFTIQNEIFEIAKFLQNLISYDESKLLLQISNQKHDLQNYFDGKQCERNQNPLNCNLLYPYLEEVAREVYNFQSNARKDKILLKQYISLFDSLLFGLSKILKKDTSSKLDQLGRYILDNETKIDYCPSNAEIEKRCKQLGTDTNIINYCNIMQQVITEINQYQKIVKT